MVRVKSRSAASTPDSGVVMGSRDLGLEEIREILPGTPTITAQGHSRRLMGLPATTGAQAWEHWPRDLSGVVMSPRELKLRPPGTFHFLEITLYQIPGIPRTVILSPQTGQVIERLDLAEGEDLPAAANTPKARAPGCQAPNKPDTGCQILKKTEESDVDERPPCPREPIRPRRAQKRLKVAPLPLRRGRSRRWRRLRG